jgi:hypothetical protein
MAMTKEKDPAEVVETIRESIEVSQRGARRVRAHRFRELFGYQAWSPQRRELVGRLMSEQGIVVQPALEDAGGDDWLVMSMSAQAEVRKVYPDSWPPAEWFDHLQSVRPATEREVEMHFASPLFQGLGYREEQEAAGFGFRMWQGVRHQNVEADLIYFADERHDLEEGQPLVLVECKRHGRPPGAGAGQVRSYSFWVKPAYYVITDGEHLTVWDYQGAIAPDVKVLEMQQSELRERFNDLYVRLNPAAALAARQEKIDRLRRSAEPHSDGR